MKRIILAFLIVLSGCSTLNKSDYSSEANIIDKEVYCRDQEHQFIEAIKWRESGLSKDKASQKMLEYFKSKYGNHKAYSNSFFEFQQLVDFVYEHNDLDSKRPGLVAIAVYESCK
ncbi:hypothetical protein [Acinetobacter sp.]|uniref:hypothetical protein n=1 Tax=Acinetobacter sp. TaxID=472 RepID=UPI00258529B6|nr:hypothetical protein [Acinetobacter sp.]